MNNQIFDEATNSEPIIYMQALNINIGDHLVIDGCPCKIIDRSVSKTGKHGGCKVNFMGIDIFTQKKYTVIHKSGAAVKVPVIIKNDYLLANIIEDEPSYLSLISEKQILREDIQLPSNDLGQKIMEDFINDKNNDTNITVTIQKSMDKESVISYKINK
jgi:translation elongation factor IF5A